MFASFFVAKSALSITFSFGDKLIIFVTFRKAIEICIFNVYDVVDRYLFINIYGQLLPKIKMYSH